MPAKKTKVLIPIGGPAFSSVRKARAALMARANEIVDKFMLAVDMAIAAEDYETATRSMQWLLEHMPEEDGQRLIEISVDKPKASDNKPAGPLIQIGFKLGGTDSIKQLPAAESLVIDVEPE